MDTTYYSFETKKVKVSGGADLLTVVPAAGTARPASPAGEVLNFDRCRRKLETRAAWNGLARAVAEVKPSDAGDGTYEAAAAVPAKRAAGRASAKPERSGGWLELCASVAVLLVCVCAGWAFLALV